MKLLNGSELAGFIKVRQAQEVRRLQQTYGLMPHLAIVNTGENSLNQTYMKLKVKYGADIGAIVDANGTTKTDMIPLIKRLNNDKSIHGIIVQLPLIDPDQTETVLDTVAADKDIDGLGKKTNFDPATPMAILWLLAGYGIELMGKQVAVVGQGRLVGAPLTRMLRNSGLTPATFDEHSADLEHRLPTMDVIISASGQPGLITSRFVKAGAVVVDAGTASEGGQIRGDVSDELYERQDIAITPRKGGVGPLTVAALFDNLLRAARAIVTSP